MQYHFAPDKTPQELLGQFYKTYELGEDGGHRDSKVKIGLTKNIYFYLPNWNDRRRALLIHDIHHIITGYKSDFKGETEISSWEIGSNCRDYWAAWILDSYGMNAGIWFNLPGVFRAFVRGRRSLNLYGDSISTEQAVHMTVEMLSRELHIPPRDEKVKPTLADIGWFLFALFMSSLFSILFLLLIPFLLLYNIYLFLTINFRKT